MRPTPLLRTLLILAGAFVAGTAHAEFKPAAIRIEGLPEGASYYWSAEQTDTGWTAASGTGLVEQKQGTWHLRRHPSLAEVKVALPFTGGTVVAGTGLCALLLPDGSWKETGIDENFRSGIVTPDRRTALVASRRNVYAFFADGTWKQILASDKDRDVYLHVIAGTPTIFTGEDVLQWRAGKIEPAGATYAWAQGPVASLAPLSDGGFVAAGKGLYLGRSDGSAVPLFPEFWKKMMTRAPVGIAVLGDTLVIASYLDGLKAVSLSTGEELWQMGLDHFGGNVWSIRVSPDGLIVGATDALYLVPDPRIYRYATYPKRDIYGAYATSRGALLASGSGVLTPDGQDAGYSGRIISLAEVKPGEIVFGGLGAVAWGGRTIKLPGIREVMTMCPVGPDAVATLQPSGACLVRRDASIVPLTLPVTGSSLAAIGNAGLMVGTSDGAYTFDQDGVQTGHFGRGLTTVRQVGAETIAVDKDGQVFNARGKNLGPLPFAELADAVFWQGKVTVLGRLRDNRSMVGTFDLQTGAWQPLDLPLSSPPQALGTTGETLFVFMFGETLATTAPADLHRPDPSATFTRHDALTDAAVLPASEDTITLTLPRPRLNPWMNPLFAYRVGPGDWQSLAPGGAAQLARLSYGRTEIEITASLAGVKTTKTYAITRLAPWWRGGLGLLILGGALTGSFWGALRWRTVSLQAKANLLEATVARRTEELVRVQKARENFFSMLSHEIRNPLNGVVGLCDLINDPALDHEAGKRRTVMRMLTECAAQLRSTVDDVLDYSRIDRGQFDLRPENFNATIMIAGAVHAVDPGSVHTQVQHHAGDRWLWGDAGKVRQVVSNLVSNALKYSSPQGAEVGSDLKPVADGKFRLTLIVTNHGATIEQAELERMLSGHGRSVAARQSGITGSGLGLAVARQLTAALGGTLDASSANGVTAFTLQLDFAAGLPPAATADVAEGSRPEKFLVIEDEPYNRWVMGHYLAKLGAHCDWASDGQTALESLRLSPYDIVITDLMLPDMEGTEILERSRRTAEAGQTTPPRFIAVTAFSTPEKLQKAITAGMEQVLTKPVSLAQLRQALWPHETILVSDEPNFFGPEKTSEIVADISQEWSLTREVLSDRALLLQSVHRLRSKAMLIRATPLADLLAQMERAAPSETPSVIARLAADIDQRLADPVSSDSEE
jgi:signal transduction histidine kinase/ActR/RegA family two-component response regulator